MATEVEAAKTFFWLTAEGWAAVAAVGTALAVGVALWQALVVRFQQKQTQTLAACGEYDLNENIHNAHCILWAAQESGDLEKSTRAYRPQISLVLNHLDAIAIGIAQKLYIDSLAYDHLNEIVQQHVLIYIDGGLLERTGITRNAYAHLIAMCERWKTGKPGFSNVITWRFWSA